jgi:superfamily II DNA or RNA helicase
VGKTLAAAKVIEKIVSLNKKAKGYIVCKENTHKKNWRDDFIKHRKKGLLKNINIILYASLHKYKDRADFVILDECHALTPKRTNALKSVLHKDVRLIFLSATIPLNKKVQMNAFCRNQIKYNKISLVKAFNLGLLPEPELIVHKFNLSNNHAGKVWSHQMRKPSENSIVSWRCNFKDYNTFKWRVPKGVGIVCDGTEKEYYDGMTAEIEKFKAISIDDTNDYLLMQNCRNKYLNLSTIRKRFIAEVKTTRVKALVEEFRAQSSRFICFTGSVKQSEEIGSDSAVHSKNTKEYNQDLIDCFNREECDELFAVKMLRESVNLTNIEKGVITQLDSTIGSFYQMMGRTLRHEFPELHIFVVDNTQDIKYFENSMKDFDEKYVKYS